jgi:hypothetical protein
LDEDWQHQGLERPLLLRVHFGHQHHHHHHGRIHGSRVDDVTTFLRSEISCYGDEEVSQSLLPSFFGQQLQQYGLRVKI